MAEQEKTDVPNVFVNRTLNMRKIRFIGLDMDQTLVRYHSNAFYELAYRTFIQKLVEKRGYPQFLYEFQPNFDSVIRGLIIDRKKGNLLKVNRYGWIRKSSHGTKPIDYAAQLQIYKSVYIDLAEADKYYVVDTAFAIPTASLFAQLIDLKDTLNDCSLPDYEIIASDLLAIEGEAHTDGSLKDIIATDIGNFIIRDEAVVRGLERFRMHGKKFFLLTNSDYKYTKVLLDYAFNPFMKEGKTWEDLFELVIIGAKKPLFFYEQQPFLRVNPHDGSLNHHEGRLTAGIFQGGNALQLTADFGLEGEEILFVGDHIYSDIIRLKKSSNWRTALVLEDLKAEIDSYKKALPYMREIQSLMREKEPLETALSELVSIKIETGKVVDTEKINQLGAAIHELDVLIGQMIVKEEALFNPLWGDIMRAGNEESYLANQTERFACIYMAQLEDFLAESPRHYFRAVRRPLAHELVLSE